MMDGGRYQRRDHFGRTPADFGTHWKEQKVAVVLSMHSDISPCDPHPELPEWLTRAAVISELAALAAADSESSGTMAPSRGAETTSSETALPAWPDIAPQLLAREVIAGSEEAAEFGWHLEWKAWMCGVPAAARSAFVADGAAVNWKIHREHFSQMTGVLDLMHALSYAYRAATVLDDRGTYRRWATSIWQGRVSTVIAELEMLRARLGAPEPDSSDDDPRRRIDRALTYYQNHQTRMNYPGYRQQGLPLTSSHIESTIKQINARIKGSEKFWRRDHGDALLQLRGDSLSDSQPLKPFWTRWRANQTGANRYRTAAA
jgi:hypothetical protein